VARETRAGLGRVRLRLIGFAVSASVWAEVTVGASVAGTEVRSGTSACQISCLEEEETAFRTPDGGGVDLGEGWGCGLDLELRSPAVLVCAGGWERLRGLGSRGGLDGGGFGFHASPRWNRGRMTALYRLRHFEAGW